MAELPDAPSVSRELARRIDQLCRDLLSAGRRSGGYWHVGGVDNTKGQSMWVHLSPGKAGHWQDAATGEFGDALDLFAACRHAGDLKAAYAGALAWLGWAVDAPEPTRPAKRETPANDDRAEKNRKHAQAIWLHGQPDIAHTPVAAYLGGRGIDLTKLRRPPRALRYHPELFHTDTRSTWPAMVAAISGADGAHIATHRTYLERTGGGYVKLRNVSRAKMVLGQFPGGSIRIARGESGKDLRHAPPEPVVVGEGIETCLSIAIAVPELRVLCAVSLSGMASIWLPEQLRFVILAADNDEDPKARMALQRAVNCHIDAGREVRIARARSGNDFNDVLTGAA